MIYSKTRGGIARRALLAGTASMLGFPAVRAQGQTAGVALVIGNSRYKWEAQLPNVRRDAPDMARRFQALGLQTELLQDVGREAMRQAVDKFKSASRGASLAAFYFAGHGASWEWDTYLVPVDADLTDPNAVKILIPVPSIRAAINDASHRLIVFDNCRNNPADGWRQVETERTAVSGEKAQRAAAQNPNTLELFSTAPGRTALDGPAGENSPFAAALMRQLDTQSVDLQTLPTKLRRDLLIATQGRQVVWDQNSYQQPFVLNAPGNRRPAAIAGGAGNSGWSGDPSRIIELPNAYALAQENGLPLPLGLIAHRLANSSSDASKIGSYKYIAQSPAGLALQILVVMSVEEKRTAEMIVAGKSHLGLYWRFVTGTLSGSRLEWVQRAGAPRVVFDWSDANSGTMSQQMMGDDPTGTGNRQSRTYTARFSRLDG